MRTDNCQRILPLVTTLPSKSPYLPRRPLYPFYPGDLAYAADSRGKPSKDAEDYFGRFGEWEVETLQLYLPLFVVTSFGIAGDIARVSSLS